LALKNKLAGIPYSQIFIQSSTQKIYSYRNVHHNANLLVLSLPLFSMNSVRHLSFPCSLLYHLYYFSIYHISLLLFVLHSYASGRFFSELTFFPFFLYIPLLFPFCSRPSLSFSLASLSLTFKFSLSFFFLPLSLTISISFYLYISLPCSLIRYVSLSWHED
jgi:hypothetical protein